MLDVRYRRTQQDAIYHIYLPCSACATARWEPAQPGPRFTYWSSDVARHRVHTLIRGAAVGFLHEAEARQTGQPKAGQWESHSLPINSICSKQRYRAIRGRWFVFSAHSQPKRGQASNKKLPLASGGTFGNCDVWPYMMNRWLDWSAGLLQRESVNGPPQKGEKNYIELKENFVFSQLFFQFFFFFLLLLVLDFFVALFFFAPVDNVFFFLTPVSVYTYVSMHLCMKKLYFYIIGTHKIRVWHVFFWFYF